MNRQANETVTVNEHTGDTATQNGRFWNKIAGGVGERNAPQAGPVTPDVVVSESLAHRQAFFDIVHSRKSVRAYKPDPVAPELIREILQLAAYAPSNCNTQPWSVHVASGATRDALSEALLADGIHAEWRGDFDYFEECYSDDIKARQIKHVMTNQSAFNVTRSDREGRDALLTSNLKFFGAPHVLFLFLPEWSNVREGSDLGQFAQTLMLALTAYGLASCPQTYLGLYAPTVRRVLGVPERERLLFGMSFGYEDASRKEARLIQSREHVDNFATFHQ